MKKIIISSIMVVFFPVLPLLSNGVDTLLEFSHRSGTIENDDLEEPYEGHVKKFEDALMISNTIIKMCKDGKYFEFYNKYVDDELKEKLSVDNLIAMNHKILNTFGKINSYKPMQWNFTAGIHNGRPIITSIKIVHHENAAVYYFFIFSQKNFGKLIGFQVKQKNISIKKELQNN